MYMYMYMYHIMAITPTRNRTIDTTDRHDRRSKLGPLPHIGSQPEPDRLVPADLGTLLGRLLHGFRFEELQLTARDAKRDQRWTLTDELCEARHRGL